MKKPTPSMAVALTALVFSATGTGIAASHYVITSTKQIKPSVLRSLKAPATRGEQGPQGFNGLNGEPVHGPEGPGGPTGKQGQQGVGGVTGPSGIALSTLKTIHATTKVPAKTSGIVTATCPVGTRLVGGGGSSLTQALIASQPEGNGWIIEVNNTTASPLLIEATAICAEP